MGTGVTAPVAGSMRLGPTDGCVQYRTCVPSGVTPGTGYFQLVPVMSTVVAEGLTWDSLPSVSNTQRLRSVRATCGDSCVTAKIEAVKSTAQHSTLHLTIIGG
jgi:hypothetical protein